MNISPFDVNYFDFDCIRNILNKDYGNTISFKAEKDLPPKYIRSHGPIITVLHLKVRVPLTIYDGKRIFQKEFDYLVNKLKVKDDTLQKIERECIMTD